MMTLITAVFVLKMVMITLIIVMVIMMMIILVIISMLILYKSDILLSTHFIQLICILHFKVPYLATPVNACVTGLFVTTVYIKKQKQILALDFSY